MKARFVRESLLGEPVPVPEFPDPPPHRPMQALRVGHDSAAR